MKTKEQFLNELYGKLEKIINESGVGKTELSLRISLDPCYINGMLRDKPNSRINTVSKVFHSLGYLIVFKNNKGCSLSSGRDGVFDLKEVSHFLKKHRVLNRFTEKGLAKRVGVSEFTIKNHIRGNSNMTLYNLYRYMLIFGFNIHIDKFCDIPNNKVVKSILKPISNEEQSRTELLIISLSKSLLERGVSKEELVDIAGLAGNSASDKSKNKRRIRELTKDINVKPTKVNVNNKEVTNTAVISMGNNVYPAINGVIKLPSQPTKLSDLTNDVGYITTCDKPSLLQRIKNLFKK